MAVNRIIVDVVSDEPIPNRTLNRLGQDVANFVQAVGTVNLENVDRQASNEFTTHHHVSTDSAVCEPCAWACRDGKS